MFVLCVISGLRLCRLSTDATYVRIRIVHVWWIKSVIEASRRRERRRSIDRCYRAQRGTTARSVVRTNNMAASLLPATH